MSPSPDSWAVRAATIDELLSDENQPHSRDPALAAARLAAWCSASTAGDETLFERRLERDGLTLAGVRERLAGAHAMTGPPPWVDDAAWITTAIAHPSAPASQAIPFAPIWAGVAAAADARWEQAVGPAGAARLTASARQDIRAMLLHDLGELTAAPLYDRFLADGRHFDAFVADMTAGGLMRLFDEKPVLLRLVALITRQWLDGATEFVCRLHADAAKIRTDLRCDGLVSGVTGGLSDRHRGGRSVLRVDFADGTRVMYKPKDVHVDANCHALIERLNEDAPMTLRAARIVACAGYGWSEFIEHTACVDVDECRTYFRRAGAWLALLHVLAAGDMHQENIVADGAHPVPVDLETILQEPLPEKSTDGPAYRAARALVNESVLSVGLLPAYARTANDDVYVVGGVAGNWKGGEQVGWQDVNTDAMRPARVAIVELATPNLPHVGGQYARLGAHFEDLIAGFRAYAEFLAHRADLLDGFGGLRVRKVIRPTQFYELLLGRLKDDRKMADGALWSARADFVVRLADWDDPEDPQWAALNAERTALLQLDVPFFTTGTEAGRERAALRMRSLDAAWIDWQCDVIRQSAAFEDIDAEAGPQADLPLGDVLSPDRAAEAADAAVDVIAKQAIRAAEGAAWIGLGWLGDSDVGQLTVLGHDLYNGSCGIGLVLAAHAKVMGRPELAELARAAVAHLRAQLSGDNAGHTARLLGVGGATGLGSVVYGLSAMAALLDDDRLRVDAERAAGLISDGLIAADRRFDVLGGAAGAILGLLRLHADGGNQGVLDRAVRCGNHLLARRPDFEMAGMSHGASGAAYALTALANAARRPDFADAAREYFCAASDVHTDADWRSQWCHGAVGVGLARLGAGLADVDGELVAADRVWPGHVDTLCCGALGNVELFREAGLREQASRRLAAVLRTHAETGHYRWNGGATRFNLGLFRGLAGVAYTCLREIDPTLPNVLIWE